MEIKRLEKEHIAPVMKLIEEYRAEQKIYLTEHAKAGVLAQLHEVAVKNESVCFVALADGRAAGYINAHICSFPLIAGKECYICDLLVTGKYRGMSLGKKLISAVEIAAVKHGAVRLMLNNGTDSDSYRRSFYAKNGFTERNGYANFVKVLKKA